MTENLKLNEILNVRRAVDVLREGKINLPFDLSVEVGHFYKSTEDLENTLKSKIKELENKYNSLLETKRKEIRSNAKDEANALSEIKQFEISISNEMTSEINIILESIHVAPVFVADVAQLKQMYQAFPVEFFIKLPDSFMKKEENPESNQHQLTAV